jgi:tRNA U34 5-methylaminomethyl-2-thiouridine-forming methyltransferase MnmC
MNPDKFLWIRTRDGSPTLWNNELGESFRSVKGAFTESWAAFVGPALDYAQAHKLNPITIGEFGLGPGTNWLLWSLASALRHIESRYFVIESDPSSFELGLEKWRVSAPALAAFLNARDFRVSERDLIQILERAQKPTIFASLDAACESPLRASAQVWFHDPFGFDVNPDGYSPETLRQCSQLWHENLCWGGSYACNRHFRERLEEIQGVSARVVATGSDKLKRERLEFERRLV